MTSSDQRSSFRLPWASRAGGTAQEPQVSAMSAAAAETVAAADSVPPVDADLHAAASATAGHELAAAAAPEAAAAAPTEAAGDVPTAHGPEIAAPEMAGQPPAGSPQRQPPTHFMADLLRAMQVAADENRRATLEQFGALARTHLEGLDARSAEEIGELRLVAQDDVGEIRAWSKAEIARVRAETDMRITARRNDLEGRLEEHAASVERRLAEGQARIAAFEQEMRTFFDRLAEVDDPALFAAAAQQLPEPPRLEVPTEAPLGRPEPALAPAETTGQVQARDAETEPETRPPAAGAYGDAQAIGPRLAALGLGGFDAPAGETSALAPADETAPCGDEADAPTADAPLTALGSTDDLEAAEYLAAEEARAEALLEDEAPPDDFPVAHRGRLGRATATAPLAGPADSPSGATTEIAVVGLVSLSSIAFVRRLLSQVPGVHAVNVSSGPDGEFIFRTSHDPGLSLAEIVPTLPGLNARVTATADGVVSVIARDLRITA